eukprot:371626-Rhodomonas_salina.2
MESGRGQRQFRCAHACARGARAPLHVGSAPLRLSLHSRPVRASRQMRERKADASMPTKCGQTGQDRGGKEGRGRHSVEEEGRSALPAHEAEQLLPARLLTMR